MLFFTASDPMLAYAAGSFDCQFVAPILLSMPKVPSTVALCVLQGRAADDPKTWGPPIDFRVYSFLQHPDLPAAVKVPAGSLCPSRLRPGLRLHLT